jgi:uncharacterized membrane protein YuzA (DUF378 family)
MALNKDIVKLLIVYIVVAVILCLVDFGGGIWGVNGLAGRLGLKIVGDYGGMVPSIPVLVVYIIMGIAVAFGLSYVYPNFTLKTDEKENKRK